MEAVVKVGGSLAENPASLRALCLELSELANRNKFLVVPGGGAFADIVREYDKAISLSSTIAHQMAIIAMDQFGILLSDIVPRSETTYSLSTAKKISKNGKLPILLPSKLMLRENSLEHSWDVTSDSIAACVALKLHAEKLILATNVDGIYSDNPKDNLDAELVEQLPLSEMLSWDKRTCVDKFLPKLLSKAWLNCYVVNGKYIKRIGCILENHETVCTQIIQANPE
jgi:aspartokinase-like uncharacterized kinase